jgi:uncharacterized damage-inducible protein DinB
MDVQAGMLSRTREKAQAAGLSIILPAGVGDGEAENGCFDRALLVTVLGEIPDRRGTLTKILQLWDHAKWADRKLLEALGPMAREAPKAYREFAHVIGTEELWLARLERRPPRQAVWPEISRAEVVRLAEETHQAYDSYLASLRDGDLLVSVPYTNSAGRNFVNSVGDILLHVALHGQYHRGKVNLLLRQAGLPSVPTDYIAFVRGAPAATRSP